MLKECSMELIINLFTTRRPIWRPCGARDILGCLFGVLAIYMLFYLVCKSRIWHGGYVLSASVEKLKRLKIQTFSTANKRAEAIIILYGESSA